MEIHLVRGWDVSIDIGTFQAAVDDTVIKYSWFNLPTYLGRWEDMNHDSAVANLINILRL